MTDSESNRRIALEWVQAFDQQDWNRLRSITSADYVHVVKGNNGTAFSGTLTRSQLIQMCTEGFASATVPLKFTLRKSIADGDSVCVLAESKGEFPGGKKYRNEYAFIFEIAAGSIVSSTEYSDSKLIFDTFAAN